jgi:hypothetical protein
LAVRLEALKFTSCSKLTCLLCIGQAACTRGSTQLVVMAFNANCVRTVSCFVRIIRVICLQLQAERTLLYAGIVT